MDGDGGGLMPNVGRLRNRGEMRDDMQKAAGEGNLEELENLIKARYEINGVDENGFTALYFASAGGHGECVQALLEAGANVNTVFRDGSNSLHAAIEKGDERCIKLLIDAGCHLGLMRRDGLTPQDVAIKMNNRELVNRLRFEASQQVEGMGGEEKKMHDSENLHTAAQALLKKQELPSPTTESRGSRALRAQAIPSDGSTAVFHGKGIEVAAGRGIDAGTDVRALSSQKVGAHPMNVENTLNQGKPPANRARSIPEQNPSGSTSTEAMSPGASWGASRGSSVKPSRGTSLIPSGSGTGSATGTTGGRDGLSSTETESTGIAPVASLGAAAGGGLLAAPIHLQSAPRAGAETSIQLIEQEQQVVLPMGPTETGSQLSDTFADVLSGRLILTKSLLKKVFRRSNVSDVRELFSGHSLVLLARRAGVIGSAVHEDIGHGDKNWLQEALYFSLLDMRIVEDGMKKLASRIVEQAVELRLVSGSSMLSDATGFGRASDRKKIERAYHGVIGTLFKGNYLSVCRQDPVGSNLNVPSAADGEGEGVVGGTGMGGPGSGGVEESSGAAVVAVVVEKLRAGFAILGGSLVSMSNCVPETLLFGMEVALGLVLTSVVTMGNKNLISADEPRLNEVDVIDLRVVQMLVSTKYQHSLPDKVREPFDVEVRNSRFASLENLESQVLLLLKYSGQTQLNVTSRSGRSRDKSRKLSAGKSAAQREAKRQREDLVSTGKGAEARGWLEKNKTGRGIAVAGLGTSTSGSVTAPSSVWGSRSQPSIIVPSSSSAQAARPLHREEGLRETINANRILVAPEPSKPVQEPRKALISGAQEPIIPSDEPSTFWPPHVEPGASGLHSTNRSLQGIGRNRPTEDPQLWRSEFLSMCNIMGRSELTMDDAAILVSELSDKEFELAVQAIRAVDRNKTQSIGLLKFVLAMKKLQSL